MSGTDDNDAYLSNNAQDASQYAGDLGFTDAVDTDWGTTLPFGEITQNAYKGITEGEWSDLFAAAADFTGNAVAFAIDPLNWLISAGLTFLIDFIQPLEDLLSLFTGNSERMEGYAEAWQRLGDALGPLGDATRAAATDGLLEWEGLDATAAKERLIEFGSAISATGGEAASIAGLLTLFSKIMSAAQQLIIGIIATLVEWMIIEWLAALALAPETLGGSVAAAGAATAVQASVATSRAVTIVDRVVMLLQKIGALLEKVLPGMLKQKVGESVADLGRAATFSNVAKIGGSVLGDVFGYAGPGASVTTGIIKDQQAGRPAMEDGEIDKALDVER
ncbi:hypothetical protein [Actinoplanes palleronii]|uniref:PPE family protein n=1 Tax=Actinoplanes palleronii TaxID=113570 RepID=A0ABQ4BK32_9ACTN|nr:hypothetical protein [Actinoplanes palleronii]GIE71045.1 hypothetical protein Apa02nite_071530 [Actinoplanes palleronii]